MLTQNRHQIIYQMGNRDVKILYKSLIVASFVIGKIEYSKFIIIWDGIDKSQCT